MNKLEIFEPAMCCSTGLCGVSVDPELLRISTVLDTLEKKDVKVERYNLSSAPQAFVSNNIVNQYIKENGVEGLPVAVLDGEIVIKGRYPSNEEFGTLLGLPQEILNNREAGASCCCEPEEDNSGSEECCCSESSSESDGSCCSGDSSESNSSCCCEGSSESDSSCCSGDSSESDSSCCSGGCCC